MSRESERSRKGSMSDAEARADPQGAGAELVGRSRQAQAQAGPPMAIRKLEAPRARRQRVEPVVHSAARRSWTARPSDVDAALGRCRGPASSADRLIAGRLFTPEDGRAAIVHEYLLYRWGLVRDEDADAALGRTFRLEIHPRPPDTVDPSWILARRADSSEKEAGRWNRA